MAGRCNRGRRDLQVEPKANMAGRDEPKGLRLGVVEYVEVSHETWTALSAVQRCGTVRAQAARMIWLLFPSAAVVRCHARRLATATEVRIRLECPSYKVRMLSPAAGAPVAVACLNTTFHLSISLHHSPLLLMPHLNPRP